MKVSDIGEFGLIDLLARMTRTAQDREVEAWRRLILGIGDDAAAWQGDTSVQLLTTDSLIQDVHFNLKATSWEDLGWRALAANLSDIAAMGGVPRYALVSLALPGDTEVEDVAALYRGMIALAGQFGVAIVGGDTSSAPLVIINITVSGYSQSQEGLMLTRSAASLGDKVAVTGYLGASVAGLEILSKNIQIDSEAAAALKEAFLKPYPRVTESQTLLKNGVRAAIDISDGLVSDLGHICQASQVGARIGIDLVLVHPAVRANFGDRALEMALSGGEDFEILFTARPEVIESVRAAVSCPITVIGDITADRKGEVTLVDSRGETVNLADKGWEHFRRGSG